MKGWGKWAPGFSRPPEACEARAAPLAEMLRERADMRWMTTAELLAMLWTYARPSEVRDARVRWVIAPAQNRGKHWAFVFRPREDRDPAKVVGRFDDAVE